MPEQVTLIQVLEVLVWSTPAALGLWLSIRSPAQARAGWCLVTLVCTAFALDKAVDLHFVLMQAGRSFVHWLDPETHLRGAKLGLRALLLGGIFLAGSTLGWALYRLDRDRNRNKLTSLLGLALVMAYLGARLMPTIGDLLESTGAGWFVEALAWALVVGGQLAGLRRDP